MSKYSWIKEDITTEGRKCWNVSQGSTEKPHVGSGGWCWHSGPEDQPADGEGPVWVWRLTPRCSEARRPTSGSNSQRGRFTFPLLMVLSGPHHTGWGPPTSSLLCPPISTLIWPLTWFMYIYLYPSLSGMQTFVSQGIRAHLSLNWGLMCLLAQGHVQPWISRFCLTWEILWVAFGDITV